MFKNVETFRKKIVILSQPLKILPNILIYYNENSKLQTYHPISRLISI